MVHPTFRVMNAKKIDKKKKTAELVVYLNNHKQIYNDEQQFSILRLGALQPRMYKRAVQR